MIQFSLISKIFFSLSLMIYFTRSRMIFFYLRLEDFFSLSLKSFYASSVRKVRSLQSENLTFVSFQIESNIILVTVSFGSKLNPAWVQNISEIICSIIEHDRTDNFPFRSELIWMRSMVHGHWSYPNFSFVLNPNRNTFGSETAVNLWTRSYLIQFIRRWKSISESIEILFVFGKI